MSNLLVGLLGALLATNQPVAVSNMVAKTNVPAAPKPKGNDPVEKEYRKLLEMDDATLTDVDKIIRENEAFAEQGGDVPEGAIRQRIQTHFEPLRKAYEDFLKRHPDHARARLAYGSFLNDIKEEDDAHEQWERARQLDPANPAAWNNLANYYAHVGPITKAFDYYAKAIELAPGESLYYHSLGTSVYLFRTAAMEHYKLNEQQVFDKALDLYGRALQRNAKDFLLATDIAQTFYGIRPPRTETALLAWNYAQQLARDDVERQGIYIHLARFKLGAGRFAEARRDLNAITHPMYADLKKRVLRNLEIKETEAKGTNAPPARAPSPPAEGR